MVEHQHDTPADGARADGARADDADDAPRPVYDGRGRRRPVAIKTKPEREREIIAILRPRRDAGLSVPEVALLISLSRYQTSAILYNLVHAEVVEAQPSNMTTWRGGRPPVLFALTQSYRAELARREAADALLDGRATPPADTGRRYTTEVAAR